MTAGSKDTLVAFQRATVVRDPINEEVEGPWDDVARVLAQIDPIKDGERVQAAQAQREVTDRMVTHWSAALWGLKAGDQAVAVNEALTYRIVGKKALGRRSEIEFTVCARPDLDPPDPEPGT
jgi:head-tail adaptor